MDQLPQTVRLAIGSEIQLASPSVRLKLEAVTQDSRCPIGATCVWAGSVTLRFSVVPATGSATEILLDSERPDSSAGVVLRIAAVTPVPRLDTTIDPKDIRVELEISARSPQ